MHNIPHLTYIVILFQEPDDGFELMSKKMSSMLNETEPTSQKNIVRSGQKRFFFDLGSNARGSYMRITEVVGSGGGPNDRAAIHCPKEVLREFQREFNACVEAAFAQDNAGENSNSNSVVQA